MSDQQSFQNDQVVGVPVGDALIGVDAIVAFLFGELPPLERKKRIRQLNHMLATGVLPARKTGKFWTGSKTRLSKHIGGEP